MYERLSIQNTASTLIINMSPLLIYKVEKYGSYFRGMPEQLLAVSGDIESYLQTCTRRGGSKLSHTCRPPAFLLEGASDRLLSLFSVANNVMPQDHR